MTPALPYQCNNLLYFKCSSSSLPLQTLIPGILQINAGGKRLALMCDLVSGFPNGPKQINLMDSFWGWWLQVSSIKKHRFFLPWTLPSAFHLKAKYNPSLAKKYFLLLSINPFDPIKRRQPKKIKRLPKHSYVCVLPTVRFLGINSLRI